MNYSDFDRDMAAFSIDTAADEPMKNHTTFRIGGPADRLVRACNTGELKHILSAAEKYGISKYIVGNGSDLLVSDRGIRGIVVILDGEFKRIVLEDEDKLKCGAGASVSSVCRYALDNSLSGLEFAWGIPGSAGGAVYMNAGAYGGEVRDIFQSAMCIDDKGQESTFNENECGFSYRHSVFQENNMIITEAVLRLHKGDKKTISSKMDELLERRKTKQPLELPSAGSTFKRPAGGYAAALIDECGLKGTKVGGASVSTKHTGFIVNDGDASCTDVLELINVIRKRVKEYKGIDLECEVKIIGEF